MIATCQLSGGVEPGGGPARNHSLTALVQGCAPQSRRRFGWMCRDPMRGRRQRDDPIGAPGMPALSWSIHRSGSPPAIAVNGKSQ